MMSTAAAKLCLQRLTARAVAATPAALPVHGTSASRATGVRCSCKRTSSSSSSSLPKRPAAFVVGAGDATGGAIARRFARAGYVACVSRRARHADKLSDLVETIAAEGHAAVALPMDARVEEEVVATVDRIEADIGPIEIAVFNIGANVMYSIVDTSPRVFRKVWEMACYAGFLVGKECAKRMLERGRGTIIFTGATASIRGRSGFAAFASAKHGLRALARSMAHELGPQGIHVSHVVIDGMIDTEWIRENFADTYSEKKPMDGILLPDDIAEQYWILHKQPRNAWTFEMDLRPWVESCL